MMWATYIYKSYKLRKLLVGMISFLFGILSGLLVGALIALAVGGAFVLVCYLFVALLNVFDWLRGE